mmetsp:Transcript_16368/g.27914  ORF Transcript_16368/g.27914 Transcript_16368/m.27914 type:complete len:410 (+) Transcript_16368:139-1368(+)
MAFFSPERLEKLKQRKHDFNAKVHTPIGSIIAYHAWWCFVTLCHWPVTAVFLLLSFVGEMIMCLVGYVPVEFDRRRTMVVAVSGCDSGFGRETALALARDDGFLVVAGCLRSESVDELQAMGLPNLKAALLDVTSDASVAFFVGEVEAVVAEKEDRSFHAVVNNAGVGSGGAVDWLSLEAFKLDMEVNYFGLVRFTKGCLPLLKATAKKRWHGKASAGDTAPPPPSIAPRVVNITSMAGLCPVPFLSPYNASKHAAEAFTACLRMELKSWDIKVTTCNPSFHTTPLVVNGHTTLDKCWRAVPQTVKDEYGEAYFSHVKKQSHEFMHANCWDPKHVVDTLRSAVALPRPRSQYLVGSDAKTILPLVRQLPSWVGEIFYLLGSYKISPPIAAAISKTPPAGEKKVGRKKKE